MKVFVINLKKNIDRLLVIDQQLKDIGVEYERVEAIYGKELSESEKRLSLNKFAWWCLLGYPARDGEIGCALSHLKIYRKMIEEDIPVACVLEDDANPHLVLPEVLKYINNSPVVQKGKKSVILISDQSGPDNEQYLIRPVFSARYTDGYIITRNAASSILQFNFPIKGPSDSWTYWRRRGKIDLYHATPCGCGQRWVEKGYVSDVTPSDSQIINVFQMSPLSRFFWKIKRGFGRIIAEIIFR